MADFKDLELIKSSKETEIVNCNILGVKLRQMDIVVAIPGMDQEPILD